ncbi:hypothetical protein BGZ70_001647 [Mortierella alpina]|uniref:DUF676 domain-containing protein n=1 Tax=Mortierella alpina TaxID=64518 RepID=A0A9P6JBP1_MORAP|nr:hypothetical protein BGZ70_001647 [Mortierella alpina]
MNPTTFLISHIRASVSATLHSSNKLYTSIKSSLGLVANSSHDSSPHNDKRSSLWHSHALDERTLAPLRHEQYPSLQPWRGLDRRIKNYGYTMPVTSSYAAPRNPIVLCHGLFGFDKMGPDTIPHLQIHYWSGVQKALTKLGAKVVVARVPKTGSISKRAEELHRMLSMTMAGMPVNFVAHSMGGLDCRYLISHIQDKNYEVQSLTTLSTPHRGSPVMDWFRDNVGVGLLQGAEEEEAMRKLGEAACKSRGVAQTASDIFWALDSNTLAPPSTSQRTAPGLGSFSSWLSRLTPLLDTPAYANLTTTYCNEVFNPNTPDDPRVSYFSYGGSVPQIPIWAPLGFSYDIVKVREGDNDGLVSTTSARWGTYVETMEADHWDLNNRRRLKIGYCEKPFDAVEFYMNLATRLFKDGY